MSSLAMAACGLTQDGRYAVRQFVSSRRRPVHARIGHVGHGRRLRTASYRRRRSSCGTVRGTLFAVASSMLAAVALFGLLGYDVARRSRAFGMGIERSCSLKPTFLRYPPGSGCCGLVIRRTTSFSRGSPDAAQTTRTRSVCQAVPNVSSSVAAVGGSLPRRRHDHQGRLHELEAAPNPPHGQRQLDVGAQPIGRGFDAPRGCGVSHDALEIIQITGEATGQAIRQEAEGLTRRRAVVARHAHPRWRLTRGGCHGKATTGMRMARAPREDLP